MSIRYKISHHAQSRFAERFPHINLKIDFLLEKSIKFGIQKGSQYLLLNEDYEIVFPVIYDQDEKSHVVKSALTVHQAKANLSHFFSMNFDESNAVAERVNKIREEARKAEEKEREQKRLDEENKIDDNDPRISHQDIQKLKILAKIYTQDHLSFPTGKERKRIFREIKSQLRVSKRNIDEYFLPEVAKLIRKKLS